MKPHSDPDAASQVPNSLPKKKHEILKWNGWGYQDSYFTVRDEKIFVVGDRYNFGQREQNFRAWIKDKLNLDLTDENKRIPMAMPSQFPEPVECEDFLNELKRNQIDFSTEGPDRIYRSHGQCMTDILAARTGTIKRIPDLVVWPNCHDQAVKIVELANIYNIMLLPFGGGTNVTFATSCPENEKRAIVSLDTTQMNRMLWIDKKGLLACFESGILGQDLERVLEKEGMTMGHEPDSHEFSTLGGWVATRASGMKKNQYGNIEDIVVNVKMVTSQGVLGKNFLAPRVSCGPDFEQMIFGSEGTLGVVTEVIIKLRPMPEVQKFASALFPTLAAGIDCFREIAKKRVQPANLRLVDNTQFKLGADELLQRSWFSNLKIRLTLKSLETFLGFDLNQVVCTTMLFEGDKAYVNDQERQVNEIIKKYGGIHTGEESGRKGYMLTFVVCYQRDLVLDYGGLNDSFETSCSWEKVNQVIQSVISCTKLFYEKNEIKYNMTLFRISQVYDVGCCVYFYTGFNGKYHDNGIELIKKVMSIARDAILESGGSLSHHHGIGKIRTKWYKQAISDVGVKLYKSTKHELDPKNIFGVGNLLPAEEHAEQTFPHKL